MGHTGKVALKKSSTLLALGNVFGPAVPLPPLVLTPEYQAVIDRATVLGYTKPTRNQQVLQDILMQSFISSGAFAKADLIYVLANDAGLNFARINWKNPSTNLLTNVGADPVKFISNFGAYANTESAAFGGLDTLWLPSTGVNFTLTNNCAISSSQSGWGSSGMAYRSSQTGDQIAFYGLDLARVGLNNNASPIQSSATSNNYNWMNRRTASTVAQLVFNNAGVVTVVATSAVAASTRNAQKLGLIGDMYSATPTISLGVPLDAFFVGGALTDAEFLNYDNALTTYLNAIRYAAAFYANGNYTVPAGITQLLVECWGGGGSGRGYPNSAQVTTGGGGAGGAYAASLINVTPGQIIPYVIGAGGVAGATTGSPGGDTSWNGGEVLAKGGAGAPASTARAAGGLASASVGTTKFDGGAGGAGGGVLNASTGSGGSGAGSLSSGIAPVDAVAASALTTRPYYNILGPGVPGYAQSNAVDAAGIPGMLGSGGSGARRAGAALRNGGAGGQGYIRVSAYKSY